MRPMDQSPNVEQTFPSAALETSSARTVAFDIAESSKSTSLEILQDTTNALNDEKTSREASTDVNLTNAQLAKDASYFQQNTSKFNENGDNLAARKSHLARHVSAEEELKNRDSEPLETDSELHFDLHGGNGARSPRHVRGGNFESSDTTTDISRHKMYKFSLYETRARYYLVGGDLSDQNFRVLKIHRTAPPGQLHLVEDDVIYSKKQMSDLLTTIEQGNKSVGGMKLRGNTWGLLGFIRFTDAYYMCMITGKEPVAMVGGHYIYRIADTELIPLTTGSSAQYMGNRNPEEQRYLAILNTLDLQRSFYYSNAYNVTRSLQHNVIRARQRSDHVEALTDDKDFNHMFVWNHHLLDPALAAMKRPYDWCMPIMHGFVDQASVDVFGRSVWITLIARRSRFFAGARFLKRGVNDLGYVANDVETEQIVAEMRTTSLDDPAQGVLKNPSYTSFVQHRGSIPLYWTQDNSGVAPKPGIEINIIDPFYSATALHFDNLFERYGTPVTVLNLVRAREKTPRETKLLYEYQNAIAYLNQPLPKANKILYRAFDMARAAKNPNQDVIASLETISNDVVRSTGIFHNGTAKSGDEACVQNGVTRSNCIDCLDRTNACQFVIGKTAFALQLQALGIIAGDRVNYDSDATNILAHMYNDHGDTLASQYGGSHLVNTTDSYRKIGTWQSHSRDMLESFKRYYHNSFLDSQRQEAYNLFLGNYRIIDGQPMLWDLPNDYYLHHAAPHTFAGLKRRDYIKWFTPSFLEPRVMPPSNNNAQRKHADDQVYESEWWWEYYRPGYLSSFTRAFAFRINSNTKHHPKTIQPGLDRSPFVVRKHPHEHDVHLKGSAKDEVGFKDLDSRQAINPLTATAPPQINPNRITSLQQWLKGDPEAIGAHSRILDEEVERKVNPPTISTSFTPADKSTMNQWTVRQFYENSLNPTVTAEESSFYENYASPSPEAAPDMGGDDNVEHLNQGTREYLERSKHLEDMYRTMETLGEVAEYHRWCTEENPLVATDEDLEKKRFQTYVKWLRGKSLFKQAKMDPEYHLGP